MFKGEHGEIARSNSVATASRFAIVVARYNESITRKLLDGALRVFATAGLGDEAIDVIWVPGAWELPVIAARCVRGGGYSAVIVLGAVIRGETTHDQYINHQVSTTLGQLATESLVPVIFGLLTCQTLEQALHRAGGNVGNKGEECAAAALEMADLLRKLP